MKFKKIGGRKRYFCPAESCAGQEPQTNLDRHIKRWHTDDQRSSTWLKSLSKRMVASSNEGAKPCHLCDMPVTGRLVVFLVGVLDEIYFLSTDHIRHMVRRHEFSRKTAKEELASEQNKEQGEEDKITKLFK